MILIYWLKDNHKNYFKKEDLKNIFIFSLIEMILLDYHRKEFFKDKSNNNKVKNQDKDFLYSGLLGKSLLLLWHLVLSFKI